MSFSWQNKSQNTPGVVYFNTNTPPAPNKADTSDFLAFTESPNSQNLGPGFTPNNYSSPLRYQRGSPRNFNQRGWRGKRYSNGNNSFNGSQNTSGSFSTPNNSFRKQGKSVDISSYLHPSFTEDPWAQLEKQLQQNQSKSA